MNSTVAQEVFDLIEAASSRHSSADFELAYQARIAIDRIRFALKATEISTSHEQLTEVRFQLLDALDRLRAADYNFQQRFRLGTKRGADCSAFHSQAGCQE